MSQGASALSGHLTERLHEHYSTVSGNTAPEGGKKW